MHISTHVFVRSPYSYSYCKEFDVLVYDNHISHVQDAHPGPQYQRQGMSLIGSTSSLYDSCALKLNSRSADCTNENVKS